MRHRAIPRVCFLELFSHQTVVAQRSSFVSTKIIIPCLSKRNPPLPCVPIWIRWSMNQVSDCVCLTMQHNMFKVDHAQGHGVHIEDKQCQIHYRTTQQQRCCGCLGECGIESRRVFMSINQVTTLQNRPILDKPPPAGAAMYHVHPP